MFQLEAPLTGRRQVARDTFVLAFEAPEVAEAAQPGQFVNLLLRPGPLLRRPFSVFRAADGRVEILLRAVGAATAQLLAMEAGDRVSMLGPLGNGFRLDPAWGSVALVSGGLGAAPSHSERGRPLLRVGGRPGGLGDRRRQPRPSRLGRRRRPGREFAKPGKSEATQVHAKPVRGNTSTPRVYMDSSHWLVAGGYDRACKEGPVYRAADVDWRALPSHLHYGVGA